MKITNCQTYIAGNPWKNWLFLKIETDDGVIGIGEGRADEILACDGCFLRDSEILKLTDVVNKK